MATYEAAAGRDAKIMYGGLCNQMYTHVGMLAVLLQLGAEVVRSSRAMWHTLRDVLRPSRAFLSHSAGYSPSGMQFGTATDRCP